MQLSKILVTTDLSERSVTAIEKAVALAADASVVDIIYVAPRAADYAPLDRSLFGSESHDSIDGRVKDAAKKSFDEFVQKLPPDVRSKVTSRMEVGVPYEVIVRVAEEGSYDLVVMSTHGRTGIQRFMLGSVTERVIRHAPCPVLTIRG